jgi:hypothetical protein
MQVKPLMLVGEKDAAPKAFKSVFNARCPVSGDA